MEAEQLANINVNTRKLIKSFMKKHNMTLNAFAREAGVHQTQLWVYLNDKDKGLTTGTIEKIGRFIISKQ